MNLRPGIDTQPPVEMLLVKVNLPFDDRTSAIAVLKDVARVADEAMHPERTFDHDGSPLRVVQDMQLNLLVGFGLRFFLGPLDGRGPEEVVQNFPPGGVFQPRTACRFGIGLHVPIYLRTMNASGDREWVKRRLGDAGDGDVEAEYRKWLMAGESDLLLYFECKHRWLKFDFWDRVRTKVVEPWGLRVVGVPQDSSTRGDGRDLIGWHDPISNMDDLIATHPQYYRSRIYLPHPAPAYPGESSALRDDPRLDGGTYLVHRKYRLDLDKWRSDDFTFIDVYGNELTGEEARQRAVGRDRHTGRILHRHTGRPLDKERDSTEVMLAYRESHVLKARGGMQGQSPAPFRAPFPPLTGNAEHSFDIQDIRVRRRGGNWRETDPATGTITFGLHFVCFQNNIQQTGFEFINNIWLMNPLFRGVDHIMDPKRGIAEPVEGCYYFVPPEHRTFPGEALFD